MTSVSASQSELHHPKGSRESSTAVEKAKLYLGVKKKIKYKKYRKCEMIIKLSLNILTPKESEGLFYICRLLTDKS